MLILDSAERLDVTHNTHLPKRTNEPLGGRGDGSIHLDIGRNLQRSGINKSATELLELRLVFP